MIMIFYCVILIPLILYGVAITALTVALFVKNRHKNGYCITDDNLPDVSIIIPFRNEEHNLPALLESLEKQKYGGMIEIVFVNDGSEDNGVDVIKKYLNHSAESNVNIIEGQLHGNEAISVKIIDLQLSKNIRLTSKQQALDLGVKESSHPLLLFTDADMILAPEWVEALVRSQMASGADLVFGHTSINQNCPQQRLFTMLESYQLEFLFAFAYAFSKLNLTGSCMGNNLLVVKDAYIKCGGQRGVGYSIVEDRALLELLRKKGFRTSAAEPFRVTAATQPARAWKRFASQTTRWIRGGLRPGGGLFIAGILLLFQNIIFPMSIFGITPEIAAIQSGINFLLTWAFTAAAFKKTSSPAPPFLYPIYYLFIIAETIIFIFSLVFGRKIEWKGRKM